MRSDLDPVPRGLLLAACAPAGDTGSSSSARGDSYAAAVADPQRSAGRPRPRCRAASRLSCLPSPRSVPARRSATTSWAAATGRGCCRTQSGRKAKSTRSSPTSSSPSARPTATSRTPRSTGRANVVASARPGRRAAVPRKARHDHHRGEHARPLSSGRCPQGTAAKALTALNAALKPGGTLLVVDHSAAAGAGLAAANTVHRMDREAAIAALTAAGFTVEAESALYPPGRRSAHRERLRPGDSRQDRSVRSQAAQAGLMRRIM